MKTLRVMGIIGLVMSAIAFICMVAWDNQYDYESAIGWGVIAIFYLIAYSIVGIVQSKQK